MALKCTNKDCKNHESDSDMNFRGVQELRPTKPGEEWNAAREKQGPERFYCYACGKEATAQVGKDDDEDALLPAPPSRPLKSGDDSPDKKEG